MKTFNPNLEGPYLDYTPTKVLGIYQISNGILTYSLKVDLDIVDDFGLGPYTVTLPEPPLTDCVFRDGGFFLNGGIHIPLCILAKAGESKAYLGYTAQNGEDIPILPLTPLVLRAKDTFFYSSGSYFIGEGKD
jgi:hypothetical protein